MAKKQKSEHELKLKEINGLLKNLVDKKDIGNKAKFGKEIKIFHTNTRRSINLHLSNIPIKQKKELIRLSCGPDIDHDDRYKWIVNWSLKQMDRHHKSEETLYYTSDSRGQYDLIMFDFDDKKMLHGDTLQAAEYIKTIFPNLFIQTSTSGTGAHGYLIIHHGGVEAKTRKEVYSHLKPFVIKLLSSVGYKCASDLDAIKGTPPVTRWVNNGGYYLEYENLGCLAKLPRLVSKFDIDSFFSFLKGETTPLERVKSLIVSGSCGVGPEIGSATTENSSKEQLGQDVTVKIEGWRQRASVWNKYRRMYPNSFGEYEGLHEYYISNYEYTPGNNSKEDRIRDWKRLDDRWKIKQGKNIPLDSYCGIINQTVLIDDFRDEKLEKRRQKVTPERMAQFLAVIVRDRRKNKYEQVAVSTYIKCFAGLKEKGIVDWTLNKNTAAFYIKLLIKYNFIEVSDDAVTPWDAKQTGEDTKARTIKIGKKIGDANETLVRREGNDTMGEKLEARGSCGHPKPDHFCKGHQEDYSYQSPNRIRSIERRTDNDLQEFEIVRQCPSLDQLL